MKILKLNRQPLFWVLFALFVLFFFLKSYVSAGVAFSDPLGYYHYYVSVNPQALVFSAVLILLLFLYRQKAHGIMETEKTVGLLRRFVAQIIDVFVIMQILLPFIVLMMLYIESIYNNTFIWEVDRLFPRAYDVYVQTLSILIILFSVLYYRYRSLIKSYPTIGMYISGYKVISTASEMSPRQAAKAVAFAFLAYLISPVLIILRLMKKDNPYWFEKTASVQARKIEIINT